MVQWAELRVVVIPKVLDSKFDSTIIVTTRVRKRDVVHVKHQSLHETNTHLFFFLDNHKHVPQFENKVLFFFLDNKPKKINIIAIYPYKLLNS